MNITEVQLGDFQPEWFVAVAHREGFVLLESGTGHRWSIVGVDPKRQIKKWDQINKKMSSTSKNKSVFPLLNGLIGYAAYPNVTLKNTIPDLRFYEFDSLLLHDHQKRKTYITHKTAADLKRWEAVFSGATIDPPIYKTSGTLRSSVTKAQYIKKIQQIKALLAAGEVYQINYAIRFTKKFEGDPYALYLKLVYDNPSEFAAYLNCGEFQIISSSPERLFRVREGKILTQPIKGTARKRANFQFLISNFKANSKSEIPILEQKSVDPNLLALLGSEKERAELDMITDLERNDVGKICKYGTLKLKNERAILELPNLWHTYSEVEGTLSLNTTPEQVITAMFPGGSITGCPKIRVMKYIEELENLPRNIYTGSIGYISNTSSDLNMDFNITIRTALIQNGQIEYWAGGGIVADSDPEKEYEECMLKAEKFLSLL